MVFLPGFKSDMEGSKATHLRDWAAAAPLLQALWERYGRTSGVAVRDWAAGLIDEMVAGGVLQLGADGVVREG